MKSESWRPSAISDAIETYDAVRWPKGKGVKRWRRPRSQVRPCRQGLSPRLSASQRPAHIIE
jgi:hypothetical protein